MKNFGTLKALSEAAESTVAETLGIKAEKAAELLLAARELYARQSEKQERQKLSLGVPGTTKEKAARSKKLYDLAAEAAEDNSLAVAEDKN